MDVIKVVIGIATSILITLILLAVSIENPEKKLYDETVETLMIQENLSSVQEVIDYFPELKAIQSKMDRIAYLNRSKHDLTGSPTPNVSKEESLQIQDFSQEILHLQKKVREELTELAVFYKP